MTVVAGVLLSILALLGPLGMNLPGCRDEALEGVGVQRAHIPVMPGADPEQLPQVGGVVERVVGYAPVGGTGLLSSAYRQAS